MESSRNDQEKKKMVIKFGAGGGIGAVVLLGGALATAALASAFLVGIKGRSSTKDRLRSPPPENSTQSEEDEANEGQEIISTDHQPSDVFERPSEGEIEEVVSENDSTEGFLVCTRNSIMDEDRIEINGGTQGYVEASDEILCSINSVKLEKDAVNDDGFVIVDEDFPLLEEESSLDSQIEMTEDADAIFELTEEDVSSDNSKESTTIKEEEEDKGEEREKSSDGGEIEVMSCKDGVEEEKDVDSVQIDQTEGEEREKTEVKMEKEEVGGVCIGDEDFPLLEEESPLDSQNEMPEDEDTVVELTEDDVSSDNSKESTTIKEEEEKGEEREKNNDAGEMEVMSCRDGVEEEKDVDIVQIEEREGEERENTEVDEEKEEVEGVCIGDGEIGEEKKCVEAIVSEDSSNQEAFSVDSEHHNQEEEEEEEKTLMAEFESVVIEQEEVDGDENESAFESEAVEIVQEDERIEESREDEGEYVEEKLVEEEEDKCEQLSDLIEEKKENIVIPYENNEEKVEKLIHEDTKVVDAVGNDEKEIEQVLVSTEDIEITKKDANEEVHEKNCENIEAAIDNIINEEADESTEESENKSEDEEDEDGVITTESSDEIVEAETSDSSTESNSEAVWPAESPEAKIVDNKLEGKFQEDKTVNGESYFSSEKSFVKKYGVDMGVVKDYPVKRRMVIGMLSLLSSLSCSWFFGLSFVKLCLVLFLTMAVSEIHGY